MEWQETQNSVELVLCSTVTVTPSAATPSRAPSNRSQNQVFLNIFPSMAAVSFESGITNIVVVLTGEGLTSVMLFIL